MVSPSSFPRTRQRPSPSRSLPWRGQRACQWHAAGWRPACAGSPAVLRCSWWAQDSDGPVREAREDTAVPLERAALRVASAGGHAVSPWPFPGLFFVPSFQKLNCTTSRCGHLGLSRSASPQLLKSVGVCLWPSLGHPPVIPVCPLWASPLSGPCTLSGRRGLCPLVSARFCALDPRLLAVVSLGS